MATAVLSEEIVTLPNGRTQVVLRGGDGPPLVFLHPGGGVLPDDPFVLGLAATYSVYAPIAPGFGDLEDLDQIQDVHELAMHYDDLFETLGLDGVPVVGYSFGGMSAAELASHYPKRVSRLVLVAPVGLWNEEYPVADLFATLPQELPALLWGDLSHPGAQAMLAGADGTPDVQALIPIVRGMTTLAKFMWPIPDRGLSRRLRRITAPTLLLWGEDDALVPARYADDFVSLIPDARAIVLTGAGHMVGIERLDAAVAAVTEFLEEGA